MENFTGFVLLATIILISGCSDKQDQPKPKLAADIKMIDSIRKYSDSSYHKSYGRTDWVTAEYFVSRKDSFLTQIMKDSFGTVRQMIIERAKRRIYVAQFYPNGQQQFKVKLNGFGQFEGEAEEYYPNGNLKRTGVYKDGMHVGPWKNYDEDGGYTFTQGFNKDGQQVDKYKE